MLPILSQFLFHTSLLSSIVLTRPADDNAAIASLFQSHGIAVCSAPMLELVPVEINVPELRQQGVTGDEPVIITSMHGAEGWLGLRRTVFSKPDPQGYYVVGERGAEKLRELDPGVPINEVAPSAEALLDRSFDGIQRLLYPCSIERRDTLVEGLRGRGIEVIELPLYAPQLPESCLAIAREALEHAKKNPPVILSFFSPSAVRNFFSLPLDIPAGAIFAAIGATTADALRAQGVDDIVIPTSPKAGGLAETLAGMPGIS